MAVARRVRCVVPRVCVAVLCRVAPIGDMTAHGMVQRRLLLLLLGGWCKSLLPPLMRCRTVDRAATGAV